MKKKVLAVASFGGHWIQLMSLSEAFSTHEVIYMSTNKMLAQTVHPRKFVYVRDANMWDKLGLLKLAFSVLRQVIAIRPEVVISTGAAPGFFAILFGKLFGAKTIWVDSIANADELSMAGKKVKPWADLWLTQWEHLQSDKGPKYYGSIL
jgi:UDP-N-acetylglucosamine:LPS N-acetylglucosamine transferase